MLFTRVEIGTAYPAVQIVLRSCLDSLGEVEEAIGRLTAAAGLDAELATDVSVAVRESVVNAIRHGNRLDATKHVHVSCTIHDHLFEAEVTDEGKGFDPSSLRNPIAEENLLRPDGRGILFIKTLMDEVCYSFPATGGTVVRMTKHLNGHGR